MKTISVKQAAEALGVSPRAIQYKLQNGDLKGTRTKNQYGVAEWRVWPNKEIAEAIAQKTGESIGDAINFAPSDTAIEAEEVVYNEEEPLDEPSNWRQVELERLELMAEKLVRPLTERIEAQAVALSEQEKIIEDQKRQLLLLPDFQKQSEEDRKAAELKALEAEALRKQIDAMQRMQAETDDARRIAEEEIQRLKEEKDAQVTAVQEQLQALSATVQELQKPKPSWWQKLFSAPNEA